AARDMRHRDFHAGEADALPHVEAIERARTDADEDFSRIEGRIGCVLIAEDFGTAVLVEANGLHVTVGVFVAAGPTLRTWLVKGPRDRRDRARATRFRSRRGRRPRALPGATDRGGGSPRRSLQPA